MKPFYRPIVYSFDRMGRLLSYPFIDRKGPAGGKVRKVLLIRLDNIGDVLTTTPAIRALRKRYSGAKIDILIRPDTKPLIAHNPDIDRVIVFDSPWLHRSGRLNFIQSLRALSKDPIIGDLRRNDYDLAIEFHTDPRNILLTYLTGAKRRIGHDVRGLGFLLTDIVPWKDHLHIIDRTFLITDYLGAKRQGKDTVLRVGKEDENRADVWIKKNVQGDFICLNPCTGRPNKFWLDDRWAKVADILSKEWGVEIVFTGGKADLSRIANITKMMRDKPKVAAGDLSLGSSAALFKRAKMLIATDTGPLHMARAVGTPVVGLFGPIDPKEWGYNDRTSVSIGHYNECVCKDLPDCVGKDRYLCMRRLTVDEVLGAARGLWKNLKRIR